MVDAGLLLLLPLDLSIRYGAAMIGWSEDVRS